MNVMKRDLFFLCGYCALIFALSSQSTLPPIPTDFELKDKVVHASAYAVMAWFAWRAFSHHLLKRVVLAGVTVAFVSLYGASDEFHQSFVAGRDADVWDWVADTSGAMMMTVYLYIKKIKRRDSEMA